MTDFRCASQITDGTRSQTQKGIPIRLLIMSLSEAEIFSEMVGTIPEVTIPDVPLGPEIGCPVMVFKMAVSSFKVNFVPWQRPSMLLATHLYPESGAWKSPERHDPINISSC